MRILVTGANGFVGTHLMRLLESRGDDIVGVSRDDFDILDAQAVEALVRSARPDAVFHLAAQASVARSFDDPVGTFSVNSLGTLVLLESLRAHARDARILVASSADTYGSVEPEDIPVCEDVPQRPVSPYAASKVAQEAVALQYARTFNMWIVVTRSFNAVGPGQATTFALSSFASQLAEIARGRTEPVMRVGNLEVERDFIDVRDVVRAQALLIEGGAPGEAYNVCRGVAVRVRDALDTLIEASGLTVRVEVEPGRLRPTDVPTLAGCNRKLCAAVPWSATISLERSLRDLFASFEAGAHPIDTST